MEKTMAVLDTNNRVVNIIIGDETSPSSSDTHLVEVLPTQCCDFGFTFDGVNFLKEDGTPCIYETE